MNKPKKDRPLTRKQQAFVRHLIENPKKSATEAILNTYNTTDYFTAGAMATENLKKPQIISELAKYNNLVENTLLNTINDYKNSSKLGERTLAVDTSKYIHDKIHGRATQRSEQQSTVVTLNLNLSDVTEVTEN